MQFNQRYRTQGDEKRKSVERLANVSARRSWHVSNANGSLKSLTLGFCDRNQLQTLGRLAPQPLNILVVALIAGAEVDALDRDPRARIDPLVNLGAGLRTIKATR